MTTDTRGTARHRRARTLVDRPTILLFSLATFLVLLALLAGQWRAAAVTPRPTRLIELRRVYRTTVIETVIGGRAAPGTSVSQSQSGGSATAVPATPVTRTS